MIAASYFKEYPPRPTRHNNLTEDVTSQDAESLRGRGMSIATSTASVNTEEL